VRTPVQRYSLVLGVGLGGAALVHWGRAPDTPPVALLYALVALLSFPLVDHVLRGTDRVLLPLTALLVALGLVTTYRLQPHLLAYQAAWVCVGMALLLAAAHAARSGHLVRVVRVAVGVLVAFTLLPWVGPEARRWLGGPSVDSQLLWELASEPVKVGLVVWTAVGVHERGAWGPSVLLWAAAVVLSVARGDLGTAAVLAWTAMSLLYYQGARVRTLWGAGAAFAALLVLAYRTFPHLAERVWGWVNPWADPMGAGFPVVQALFALGSGGLFGVGPGRGHPELVPGAHSGFALVALAEEWGFAAVGAVLAAYALWVGRVFRTSLKATDPRGRLLAAGAGSLVAGQAVLAAAGSTGLLPGLEVPLPFLSYGTVSVASSLALLGAVAGLQQQEEVG